MLHRTFDHAPWRTNLGLSDCGGHLDIDDSQNFDIDQIDDGMGEEGLSAIGSAAQN